MFSTLSTVCWDLFRKYTEVRMDYSCGAIFRLSLSTVYCFTVGGLLPLT